jgi:hypothetical protein
MCRPDNVDSGTENLELIVVTLLDYLHLSTYKNKAKTCHGMVQPPGSGDETKLLCGVL